METKETLTKTDKDESVLNNTDYFRFIFKKTEKIACAVFYILRSSHDISQSDVVVSDLEYATQKLLNVSLESLKYTPLDVSEKAIEVRHALVACESKLRVANASRLLNNELLEVFVHEIDSVQRSLRKYTESSISNPLDEREIPFVPLSEKKHPRLKMGEVNQVGQRRLNEPHTQDRKERVLNVIKDKGEATIKDIVGVISDCSEKTIQRELINLIKDNIIIREGERRWSKYRLNTI